MPDLVLDKQGGAGAQNGAEEVLRQEDGFDEPGWVRGRELVVGGVEARTTDVERSSGSVPAAVSGVSVSPSGLRNSEMAEVV